MCQDLRLCELGKDVFVTGQSRGRRRRRRSKKIKKIKKTEQKQEVFRAVARTPKKKKKLEIGVCIDKH